MAGSGSLGREIRRVFPVTVMLLANMAKTAIKGFRQPAMAGTNRRVIPSAISSGGNSLMRSPLWKL